MLSLPTSQRTRNPQRQSVSVVPSSFSRRLCDDQVTVLGHGHTQSTNHGMASVKRFVIPLQLWRAKLEQEHAVSGFFPRLASLVGCTSRVG